jgi:hypothetical protein
MNELMLDLGYENLEKLKKYDNVSEKVLDDFYNSLSDTIKKIVDHNSRIRAKKLYHHFAHLETSFLCARYEVLKEIYIKNKEKGNE